MSVATQVLLDLLDEHDKRPEVGWIGAMKLRAERAVLIEALERVTAAEERLVDARANAQAAIRIANARL